MAGAGPPPKPPGQRRRRNASPGAITLPATGPKRARLPKLPGSSSMLGSTRAWWRTVWASPMAAAWLDADVPALVRLAQLQDLVARELNGWTVRDDVGRLSQDEDVPGLVRVTLAGPMMSTQLLAEIRQLEDRLGLSPTARRRLQWEIGSVGRGTRADGEHSDELAARRERFARAAAPTSGPSPQT